MGCADTSRAADRVYFEILRQMTGAERAQAALELTERVLDTSRAGILFHHPAYSEAEVHLALCRLTLGDDLFRRAFPESPLVAP